MSRKLLSIGLNVAGLTLFALPGAGLALGLAKTAILAGLTASQVIGAGILVGTNILIGPAKPRSLRTRPSDRLLATMETTAPRKIWFGEGSLGSARATCL